MKTAFFVGVLAFTGQAAAQQPLIDTAPAPTGSIDGVCNGGVTVAVQAARATTLGRIDQQLTAATATQVRFAVWSGSSLVFYSLPVPIAAGTQVVRSPDFTLHLTANVRYHVGAIVQGCADFPTDAATGTANAIQSFATNGLPTSFASPVGPNQVGTADPRVVLYTPSIDVDGDGVANAADNCPFDWQADQGDTDADGQGDACDAINNLDVDNDSVANVADNCPFDSNASQADLDADGQGDACDVTNGLDLDGDTIPNTSDNCPFDANTNQADTDGDGLGNACDGSNGLDLDGDGVSNLTDNCPFAINANQADLDGDGIGDVCDPEQSGVNTDIDNDGVSNVADNCPFDVNAAQLDGDTDGLGDVCDPRDDRDLDGDGVPNANDNCAFDANAEQPDLDDDGVGDACDETNGLDVDDDLIENLADNCPFVANAEQADADDDGLGDACDPKSDGGGGCSTGTPGLLVALLLLLDRQRPRGRRRAARLVDPEQRDLVALGRRHGAVR